MNLAEVLALLVVVVAAPLNWVVTVLLWRLSRSSPDVRVLRERAIVAFALSIIVTIFALIFVNNDLTPPPLSNDVTKIITRGAILVISIIPPLFWLRIYR